MQIILAQDIRKLGKAGDVVKVKEGFARNYLLPKKIALLATAGNVKRIEARRALLREESEKQQKAAQELAEKLNKLSCTVTVEVNDLDKLYGSVTTADIVKALEVEGFTIEKKALVLDQQIQDLGVYDIGIQLHPQVTAKIKLWVAKK